MATDSATVPTLNSNPHLFGERIVQQLTLFIGGGYVFYLVLSVPLMGQSAAVTSAWWTVLAVVLMFGIGIAMGLSALFTAGRILRVAAGCASAGYVVALMLWPVAWNGGTIDADTVWFQTFVGIPALAAAVAGPVWVPFVYLFCTVTAVQVINVQVRAPVANGAPVAEAAWTFAWCLVPIAAGVMAVRSARLLDATRESSLVEAAERAAVQARAAERTRLNALTHDGVMTTLLMAARRGRTPTVARQAAATLADMEALAAGSSAETDVVGESEVVAGIRSAVAQVDPHQRITIVGERPGNEARYPTDAVVTLAAACAEAVRNSGRHAGEGAQCSVSVDLGDGGIEVTVRDDGCGFDPRSVPPDRFGVAVSIRQRMAHLSGGAASVVSVPGSGTVVTLRWVAVS
ncbi:ATP-binding protein [Rhodococcus sp. Q]|uniref:sensor histidine kinase n=1 Tax=Rhodococcus sp. Q TaxID=2502252 RepID=UPI0010F6E982|nr:ATP-binding protein [Rhodococcus sp. Q]